MFHQKKKIISKKPFPYPFLIVSLTNFADNLESIYFINVMKIMKEQWSLSYLSLGIIVGLSFVGMFLGSYLSRLMLKYNAYRVLLVMQIFQSTFCVLCSFSRNLYEIILSKLIYGLFYGSITKLMVLHIFRNAKFGKNTLNQSVFSLQMMQTIIKLSIFLLMLLYEANGSDWRTIWFYNFSPIFIFFVITLFGVDKKCLNFPSNDLPQDIPSNSGKKDILSKKTIVMASLFLALVEFLNKVIFLIIPFLSKDKNLGRLQILFIFCGEIIGLFIVVMAAVSNKDENNPKTFLYINILCGIIFNLGLFLKFDFAIWFFLLRAVIANIRNVFFENIVNKIENIQLFVNFLCVGDFTQILLPLILFPNIESESFVFSLMLVMSLMIGFLSFGINPILNKDHNLREVEMSLLQ